ncbi:MAG: nicotinate phosphoribosyltransferase [Oscillospiraceae bacterium]|nr:nicotinate phosphoribosyltransferase [Oscillospiraceae bacterium]RKJ48542.1 nicotinate phosphoribosyltransferase [bacterium 1XD42-8]RKJ61839.1 nicotinate phosphoribosyltransferase [bacterium 1XD42-1]
MNLKQNLSMLTDFYEITMSNGYFSYGMREQIAVFDMFFRKIPDEGGFAIAAGLEQLIEYLENLHFTSEDIAYLREKGIFNEEFLDYLADFHFACDIWAVPEGTPVFPNEPIVVVRGPIIQAQLIETMVLLTLNHQSLIATKSNRIVRAAQGRPIAEFGSRRAQSFDAAVLGARAAYIGGCATTACVMTDRDYGVPAVGTMAHSWVQLFDSEYESFEKYARLYPNNCVFLVDTYNVLKSGVPNAIRVADEVLAPMGYRPKAIRIDSGDIAYLSKKSREMLDKAGYSDCKIMATNSLDEYLIRDLIIQGARIDQFGVGERLITSKSDPVFGGVYKMAAVERDGEYIPKIKISETVEKITTPCFKELYRFYNRETGQAIADYVTIRGEVVDDSQPITIFDPVATWKKKTVTNFIARPLLEPIFAKGKLVYEIPPLKEVQKYCLEQVSHLWDEVKRFEYPHRYYVDLSKKLWEERSKLLDQMTPSV